MNRTRVAVTGLGLVTPFGLGRECAWNGLSSGKSAVRWLGAEVVKPLSPNSERSFGAAVSDVRVSGEGRLVTFARLAACEAVEHAGLTRELLESAACVIGTSKLDMNLFDELFEAHKDSSDRGLQSPAQFAESGGIHSFFSAMSPSAAVEAVSRDWNCQGGTLAPVAACATGLVSIARGAQLIQSGHCPVVLAGSADSSLHPGYLASYKRLGVHARAGDDPAQACRPFDKTRQGFAVGEGAACLILEDWDHALNRNARIYAEWLGARIGSDPSGLTLVNNDGQAMLEVTQRLLADVGLEAREISCVSLHGTATQLNDRSEAIALQRLFKDRSQPVPAFGIKGSVGHLMGAAGSVETAAAVLSLIHQQVLPTCNHFEPENSLPIRLTPAVTSLPLKHILKVSLGFGGHVAAGILKKVDDSIAKT